MPPNSASFEVSHPDSSLLKCFQRYRLENKLTDITLRVGREEFAAHRLVLESWSPTLKELLSQDSSPDNVHELNVQFIDSVIMGELLSYFYSAKLLLTPENAPSICRAASFLKLEELTLASENYLGTIVSPENVFNLLFHSDEHKLDVLEKSCVNYLNTNLEYVFEEDFFCRSNFVHLSAENIQTTMCKLNTQRCDPELKEALYEWIVLWVKHDLTGRSPSLPSLLKCLPLHEMSGQFLDEIVSKESLISDFCSKFLMKFLRQFVAKPQLYCFGGLGQNYNALASVSRLNNSTGKWEEISELSSVRADFSGAVIENKIYLCGGTQKNWFDNRMRIMEVFDCKANTWAKLRKMPEERYGCAAAALNGRVYVAGGKNSIYQPLSSVDRYNVQTDQWVPVQRMCKSRFGHQLLELNGRLYAINGWGRNSVEEYNPTIDQWRMVASTRYQHWLFGAASYKGKIYVCSHKGFEVYSPESNTWSTLAPPANYWGRTLVAMNDQLWAIGGSEWSGGGSSYIFSFDLSTGQWTPLPDMDVPRKRHCSFVVNL